MAGAPGAAEHPLRGEQLQHQHRDVVVEGGEPVHLADRPVLLEGAPAVAWLSPKGSSTNMPLAKILARSRYAAVSTTRNINTVHRVLRLLDA